MVADMAADVATAMTGLGAVPSFEKSCPRYLMIIKQKKRKFVFGFSTFCGTPGALLSHSHRSCAHRHRHSALAPPSTVLILRDVGLHLRRHDERTGCEQARPTAAAALSAQYPRDQGSCLVPG